MLKNDRLIKALKRQPVDRPPVWLMRQAGRYLPEYRELRKKAGSFLTLCKTPELACEVTLQPLKRFPLDAAIIFSDILTIPDAMGLGLHFVEGEGPKFESPIQNLDQVKKLFVPERDAFSYLTDAIKLVKHELNDSVPLIGFSGSPWTLATYMIEGGSSKDFRKIRRWRYADPDGLNHLLSLLADCVTDYLLMQIEAGAQVVMMFDTWGGVLSSEDYRYFSLLYMQKVVQKLKISDNSQVPIVLFTKNGGQWLEAMAASGCDALGIDWTTDMAQAKARVSDRVALQGNLDPAVLYASNDFIAQQVRKLLTVFGNDPGLVINLGHGVPQDVNPDHVLALINSVHEHSSKEYDKAQ